MKLKDILNTINIHFHIGSLDTEIREIYQDTRNISVPESLYVAVKGTQVDGHIFIDDAIEKGASAIVCEELPERIHDSVVYIQLDNTQKSLGEIASQFYGNPSEKLKVIATTGTNGKTTIATLLHQSLNFLGKKAALFSTAGDYIGTEKFTSQKHAASSMEPIEFQKNLARAVKEGCSCVCIEATSHALDQYRLTGTNIAVGIFTNLTQDHLNYHGTMENYAAAKKKLFSELLDKDSYAIINIDDAYGAFMVEQTSAQVFTYGNGQIQNPIVRDYSFDIQDFGMQGTHVSINKAPLQVPLIGVFNMYNITAVYISLEKLGFEKQAIADALSQITGSRGRMEIVSGDKEGVIGIVDYAHTPDALENALTTLAEVPHRKIITVVGVGGDRDRSKRPLMAAVAQKQSDYVFFTSDNPRTENPKQIFKDLLSGCKAEYQNYTQVHDREEAIKKAVLMSGNGDIIFVAGKGHEEYQEIMGIKHYFSDQEVLKKYLVL